MVVANFILHKSYLGVGATTPKPDRCFFVKNYYQLLKDPRWWRKRRIILKRDKNKCTVCGSTKKLKIHHTFYYDKDTSPWLYPNKSLLTLCDDCHKKYHESNLKKEVMREVKLMQRVRQMHYMKKEKRLKD